MSVRDRPRFRRLRVYAFDPSRGRRLGNYMTVRVPFEPLQRAGDDEERDIHGDQIHVIDYDASNKRYYAPALLNGPAVMLADGYEPGESDPRFHQQMVYAVAMNTIGVFEAALGRRICFPFHDGRLRIYPHAMYEANAYYHRELGALVFGYFRASADTGQNLPGQTVFTCLSHDIIAHETTHAIVDTLRPHFLQPTHEDVAAFHEAFADIVALFQHFCYEEVVRDALKRTDGVLYKMKLTRGCAPATADSPRIVYEIPQDNPLLDLARQFGDSMGLRAALRSGLGVAPNPDALRTATEAHERGAILVSAVFDAFFTSFMKRTEDLVRIGKSAGGELHPDLVNRLAAEASKTAKHFCTMSIRALDYCAAFDIRFGEFLRALITADTELYQSDAHDYREALIQAFAARGIYPEGVRSLAEESLLWDAPDDGTPRCDGLTYDHIDPQKHEDDNRRALENIVRMHPGCFGVCDQQHSSLCNHVLPIDVPNVVQSVRAVVRGGESRPVVDFIAEIVRTIEVEGDDGKMKFTGGSTVIFDSHGTPKFVVMKRLSNTKRLDAQREFTARALSRTPAATYLTGGECEVPMHFAAIHRGC